MISFFSLQPLKIFPFIMLLAAPLSVLADSLMFQADLERTGVYDDVGPEDDIRLKWKFEADAAIFSTPIVYKDMVYFTDMKNTVYAINEKNGSLSWRKNLKGQPSFQITLKKEILLVGVRNFEKKGCLIAINRSSGDEIWRFEPENVMAMDAPTIYEDMVFATSRNGHIFSINLKNGKEIWEHPIQGGRGQPLISNSTLYFQDAEQNIHALSLERGHKKWFFKSPFFNDSAFSTPAIEGCCIYAIINKDNDGNLIVLNKNSGKEMASYPLGYLSLSSVSLADGVAFFGDEGKGNQGSHGHMNAINIDTGKVSWRFETGGFVRGAASIAGDTVYFGSHDHYFYAVDRQTGELKWKYETGAGIASTPAVVDGRVYFGSLDGNLYVLE